MSVDATHEDIRVPGGIGGQMMTLCRSCGRAMSSTAEGHICRKGMDSCPCEDCAERRVKIEASS